LGQNAIFIRKYSVLAAGIVFQHVSVINTGQEEKVAQNCPWAKSDAIRPGFTSRLTNSGPSEDLIGGILSISFRKSALGQLYEGQARPDKGAIQVVMVI
jgi:hypothetical protein